MTTLATQRRKTAGAKGRRLSRSTEFQRVYRQGRSKANRYLVLYSFARGDGDEARPRFGVSVGRKVGNAVVRNRVKRTIREAFAELEPNLPDGLDYVVLARADAVELVDRDGMRGLKDSLSELISPKSEATQSPSTDSSTSESVAVETTDVAAVDEPQGS